MLRNGLQESVSEERLPRQQEEGDRKEKEIEGNREGREKAIGGERK